MRLPIVVDYIPAHMSNRRTGQGFEVDDLWITVHETGNQNSAARNERNFSHGGGGKRKVAYHLTVDDQEAYQLLPLNERGKHAGPDGDRASIAIETCINIAEPDWQSKTIPNLVELIAGILTGDPALQDHDHRRFSIDRIRQHSHWSNTGCPARIRRAGNLWEPLLATIRVRVADLDGAGPGPGPTNPEGLPFLSDPDNIPPEDQKLGDVPIYRCFRQFTPLQATPVLEDADRGAPQVRDDLQPGETFTVEYVFEHNGEWWGLSRWASRVPLTDCTPTVRIQSVTAGRDAPIAIEPDPAGEDVSFGTGTANPRARHRPLTDEDGG